MTWNEPRRVDVWWWMDIEVWDGDSIVRYGRVSWNQDGTGYFDVSITYESEGLGLHCWPDFRVLSDAQDFVEQLMAMPSAEARKIHGQQWPNVVL